MELKEAEIVISLSLNQQTASIKDIKIYVREVTANVANFSKGSDLWQIERYDTELTQSGDINEHRLLDVNHLEHYSTERNIEKKSTANLSLPGGDRQMKPLPVDRTFDSLSNGMHNSIFTKMSLRTL